MKQEPTESPGRVLAGIPGLWAEEDVKSRPPRVCLDLDTGNLRVLFGLLGMLRAFARAQPIPDELDAEVAGVMDAAGEPEYGAPAARLATLLGIPAGTDEARLVLSTLLATFVEDAYVPPVGMTEELAEETGRVVGVATPLEPADPALYASAAAGFGVPGFLEDSAGIYRVCNRASVFLVKTVFIRSL